MGFGVRDPKPFQIKEKTRLFWSRVFSLNRIRYGAIGPNPIRQCTYNVRASLSKVVPSLRVARMLSLCSPDVSDPAGNLKSYCSFGQFGSYFNNSGTRNSFGSRP